MFEGEGVKVVNALKADGSWVSALPPGKERLIPIEYEAGWTQ